MKLHEQLSTLVAARTEVVFGLVGDANLFFVDHLRRSGGRYVPALHEASALMMAIGHAHASSEVAVATVTHGPGLANVVTPLIEAAKSSVPLVLVAGDTATTSTYHPQHVEQRALVEATGAGFVQVRSVDTLAADLDEAFGQARRDSRPVVLNVPIDYMWADVSPAAQPAEAAPLPSAGCRPPAADQLDTALGMIASARRPLLLAGRGARGARSQLVRLGSALGAPLATTLLAKDLFHGEPADLGVFGTLATPAAQDVIADADCVVAFGAGLNPYTSDHGHLVEGKTLIQVDVDPDAVGRHVGVDAAVVGDAAFTADAMVELLRDAEHSPRSFNEGRTLERLRAWPQLSDRGTAETVDMLVALAHLERVLPRQRGLVVDIGRFSRHAIRLLHAPDASSWLCSGTGFAAIGLGMGAAIGAAIARPGRPSVLVAGDGGFMLGGLNEFRTAVDQRIDLICVVCNDGSYGAEYVQFTRRGMAPELSLLTPPDFVALAEAMGGTGIRVRNAAELEGVAEAIDGRERPLLIDLQCDPARLPDAD